MASRMDRYHDQAERSTRNEQLYRSIENLNNYSNIEGVVAIDKTNEIDITRVKAMLQNREGYQQEKRYRQLVSKEEPTTVEPTIEEEEERTYDIRDVLTKAKETRSEPEEEEYRSLKNTSYDIVKKLNLKPTKEEADALKELIDTITIHEKEEGEEKTEEQDSDAADGLFDDLKSDTMVGDPTSIHKIIEDAKKEEEKQEEERKLDESTSMENIDKTFYTSSLGFTESDFEDLKNLGENVKKHNILLRILIIGLTIVGIVIAAFLIYYFLLK